jgi:hypothetical protein
MRKIKTQIYAISLSKESFWTEKIEKGKSSFGTFALSIAWFAKMVFSMEMTISPK